jgi:hypothetical protein
MKIEILVDKSTPIPGATRQTAELSDFQVDFMQIVEPTVTAA